MSRGVFVVVKPGAFSAQESSSRPVKGPHIFMAGHPDAVTNSVGIFARVVVVKSREKYDFLSVVCEGTEISAAYGKNTPKDNARLSRMDTIESFAYQDERCARRRLSRGCCQT